MLIYLLRHGETVYNTERRYQGSSDIPLSDCGRAALHPADFCVPVVYSSPLIRAFESARIIFPTARVERVPALREMDFGRFEGHTYLELKHDPEYCTWVNGGCKAACPGSREDRAAFIHRSCVAFCNLMERALSRGEETLVIMAHGGTQMAVLSSYVFPRRDYFEGQSGRGGGFILDASHWTSKRELALVKETYYCRG